jgi:hypothetical protein
VCSFKVAAILFGAMVACLNADKECSDEEQGQRFELTDFEQKMLHSAKTLSESMQAANDLFSSFKSTISDDESLRTVKISEDASLRDISLTDTKINDEVVRTKEEDTQVSTAGKMK